MYCVCGREVIETKIRQGMVALLFNICSQEAETSEFL